MQSGNCLKGILQGSWFGWQLRSEQKCGGPALKPMLLIKSYGQRDFHTEEAIHAVLHPVHLLNPF